MKVTDIHKWQRTKVIMLALITLTFLWSVGGDSEEAMPYPDLALALLLPLGYMTHNLTKHWKH